MSDRGEGIVGHEELQELCAGHALGILDPPESALLEAHLRRGCGACEAEIAAFGRSVGALGSLAEPIPPPAGAERTLEERIAPRLSPGGGQRGGRRAAAAGTSILFSRWLLPAAAILVAAVSLWMAVDARRQASSLVRENLTLHQLVDRTTKVLAVEIRGVGGFEASGLVFLDPGPTGRPEDDLCSLHLGRLPPPPAGRVYQAWAVLDGKVHDLGTIRPDESGFGFTRGPMPSSVRVTVVQVTVEPLGGATAPTGPPVLLVRRSSP